MSFARVTLLMLLLISQSHAWAWGRRGHALVCQEAAYLVANQDDKANFLKNHSFDLGYYCNVPDVIWKEPPTGETETPNHYINHEVFVRAIGADKVSAALAMDRATFEKTYPQVPAKNGRIYWRIREMNDALYSVRDKLMNKNLKPEEKRPLQAQWLQLAGFMGHYIGDLSMPLHVTENHNGALTHQDGIHSFYEDKLVNELFMDHSFELEAEAMKLAQKRWAKEHVGLAKRSIVDLMEAMRIESAKSATLLLKTDLATGRDLAKAKRAHKKMILENLAMGGVYLAEFYRRGLGFDFDDNRFFIFNGKPDYIQPGPIGAPVMKASLN